MFQFHFTLATALILIPAIGALGVFVYPEETKIGRYHVGVAPLALLVALVEIGVWILALRQFKFDIPQALQMEQRHTWFKDIGVSYDVALWGPGLWLVGLAVVVMAA